jgi:GAF domain-containing protein
MPDDDDTHPLAHLGSQFADLNREVTSTRNDRVDVQRVVRIAARAVPHSTHCGLSLLVHGRAPRTIAATGSLPNQVDGLQYSTGEGPCLDAAKELTAVIADDLATDSRWPRFAPACVEATGVRTMLSVRLAIGGDDQGALNFYAPTAGAFTPSDEAIASIFAPFAALAVERELREHVW